MIVERAEIRTVGIVVPARNEQDTLAACVHSIRTACRFVHREFGPLRTVLRVVLDDCTDDTWRVAENLEVTALVSRHGRVGAARRLGIGALLDGRDDIEQWWIACTDADSVVPPTWLVDQVRLAAAGADLVLGTVLPTGLEPEVHRAWMSGHDLSDGHGHVFGANLGVRAQPYLDVGGFPDIATGEDVALAESIRRTGARVIASGGQPVLTSGRREGRAPAGMAGYLEALGEDRRSA